MFWRNFFLWLCYESTFGFVKFSLCDWIHWLDRALHLWCHLGNGAWINYKGHTRLLWAEYTDSTKVMRNKFPAAVIYLGAIGNDELAMEPTIWHGFLMNSFLLSNTGPQSMHYKVHVRWCRDWAEQIWGSSPCLIKQTLASVFNIWN